MRPLDALLKVGSRSAADDLRGNGKLPFTLADMLEDELDGKVGERKGDPQPGEEAARLKQLHKRLHAEKRSALCLSGGGIRSATFSLGVLQALAKRKGPQPNDNLLTSFDYLSTVSGGGYIGAWLSAWIANSGGNVAAVAQGLNKDLTQSDDEKRDPESEPIRHLRRYSNYLTPKLGFFSSDTWTLVATVLRNIFLNWLMLIPIIALALMVPRLFSSLALGRGADWWQALTVIGAGFGCMLIATTFSAIDLPSWRSRGLAGDRWGHVGTEGRFWICLLCLGLSALLISLGWFWLLGNFPSQAELLRDWACPNGAWWFIYAMLLGTLPSGLFALFWLKLRLRNHWQEGVPMLVTGIIGGAALWWVLSWVFEDLVPYEGIDATEMNYICFAPSLILLVLLFMNFMYVVTFSRWTTIEDREWWARSAGWILIAALAWAVLSAITFWGPIGLQQLRYDRSWTKNLITALGSASGIVTALVAFSARTTAKKKEEKGGDLWLSVGAIVFLTFLLVYVAIFTSWLLAKFFGVSTDPPTAAGVDYRAFYSTVVLEMELQKLAVVFGVFFLITFIVGFLVNVNQFSLHAMYHARLTRAFLGASRPASNPRRPHWFTGFDADDKIKMHELNGTNGEPRKLFHVVNTAMNLVAGEELAWQERMAQSFTITPLHCGNWNLGYRPSDRYYSGVELGTAITVSGAAANPNMGYHSSPLVSILMTLFNVRLGWWAGNPGKDGADSWNHRGPIHAAWPLVNEAFGNTTDRFRDVNLSDGGHFENLGLYEMILRRCHRIVVVDAGRDTDYVFEDLGNAIRKIRIDFGIPIDIVLNFLAPNKEGEHLARFAVGDIHYEKVDKGAPVGKLIYLKPLLRKDEPVDIRNYAAAHPGFPHETTSDQWFSESQLESYRMLGFHTVNEILKDADVVTMEQLFAHVEKEAAEIARSLGNETQIVTGDGLIPTDA